MTNMSGPLLTFSSRRPVFSSLIGVSASLAIASCFYKFLGSTNEDIIESPLTRVHRLPYSQKSRLPLPPDDVLPGARDVCSPYGNIRVYEFGPEGGRKVLLVHGISTPCIALGSVAESLANNGCRVMLFDLFGRGYSSTPNPSNYPQDMKLFTSQILLVLASSPISWTGHESIALIGYSLGGGIVANFTAMFPSLVDSLILLTPGGLMRRSHIHWTSKLIYGKILPSSLVSWLVWRRLGGNSTPLKKPEEDVRENRTGQQVDAEDVVAGEAASHPALSPDSSVPLSPRRPSVSVADAVAWQLENHKGFLPAFISSIQHAPISGQHVQWRKIGSRLAMQRDQPTADNFRQGLREGKVLLILGKDDDVVIAEEVAEDAREVLGREFVDVQILDGGHDLPVARSENVARTILDFWATPVKQGRSS